MCNASLRNSENKEIIQKNDLLKISELLDGEGVVNNDTEMIDTKDEFLNNSEDKIEISVDDIINANLLKTLI